MALSATPDAIATILANPSPDSSSDVPDIVVQVVDLRKTGNRYMFSANDGKQKLKGILQSMFEADVVSGKIQNLGLIRVTGYSLNDIPSKNEKYMIVTNCEAVSPALEAELKSEEQHLVKQEEEQDLESGGDTKRARYGDNIVKKEYSSIVLKPKNEVESKSAAQIVREQHENSAPSARMAMTRRVHPLVSLNPYQGNWTIKVRVTNKGNLRSYKNARGEGHVFTVELTDEDGTQIQATMFGEAAKKFYDKFQLGKVYYISKGMLKVANKQFNTVKNDYEMTLTENSVVEEATSEAAFIPEIKFNFVSIDQLGPYVNGRELVDVIGVVQSVSPTMSIRRKSDNESIPKRDITIADDTKKTVSVSLWNDLATGVGQELLDIVDSSPVVAIKSLKVGDFQGVSLSTVSRSSVVINPDLPEARKLRSWYDSEGKGTSLASVGSGMSPSATSGARSMYSDRVGLSFISRNPSLGEDKPAFFSIRAFISFIKPDQPMYYRACNSCNKKVTEAIGSGYWCEGCQKQDVESSLRYIMVAKVSDATGEIWLSIFNDQAESILGCSADELDSLKSQEADLDQFQIKLKQATWVPHLFRVSVTQNEYMNEKRQRVTARAAAPVDYAAESKFILDEMAKMKVSAAS
uniref:Replication protein A subunit n=1 Tax=Kalanchoe fedtschenkoi TaxID=63787 RepID=A0A7N0T1I7_KALFE